MAGPLLETNLQGVVPGTGFQQGKSLEVSIELGIRAEQVHQGNTSLAIIGVRLIENCRPGVVQATPRPVQPAAEQRTERVGDICLKIGADTAVNIAVRV